MGRAAKALMASELRYRRLFESAKDGILILEAETGMILDVNPFLRTLLGYSHEEFLGKRVWDLGFLRELIPNVENFQELMAKGYIRYENLPLKTASGKRIEVEFVSNVYMVEGQPVIQCNIRDITERVRDREELFALNASLEELVRERTAQLQAANQELEAFAFSISHDLKAPLRAIAGFSLAVLEDYAQLLPAEGKDHLRCVREEALRMGILIDDLLRLSRFGQQTIAIEEVDATALALSVLKGLTVRDPLRKVEWEVAPGLRVHADPILLRVVLENLLENAWKFTSKTGEAWIRVRPMAPEPGWSGFSVADNGAGFDPVNVGELCTPFRRLHSLEEFPGTGIGLAIVRRIANRHGALLTAEGSPGLGATFSLKFPVPAAQD